MEIEARQRVVSAWQSAFPRAPASRAAELDGWLELLGQKAALPDLLRQVALWAENAALEGQPASVLLKELSFVHQTIERQHPQSAERFFTLLGTAMDAHGAGQHERWRRRNHLERARTSPVFGIRSELVAAFYSGAFDSEPLDAVFGRLLLECAGRGATWGLMDVSGARPETDLFHRTLRGFPALDLQHPKTLVITGLADPDATRAAVEALGYRGPRIHFESDIGPVLDRLLTNLNDR